MESATDSLSPDQEILLKLAHARMPFGRFAKRYLSEIPEEYFIWFAKKGFPKGELGQQMAMMLDIKANGLEHLLRSIRDNETAKP